MSYHHINILLLTNIELDYYFGVNVRKYPSRMKIRKDKIYTYYCLFKNDYVLKGFIQIMRKINVVMKEKN